MWFTNSCMMIFPKVQFECYNVHFLWILITLYNHLVLKYEETHMYKNRYTLRYKKQYCFKRDYIKMDWSWLVFTAQITFHFSYPWIKVNTQIGFKIFIFATHQKLYSPDQCSLTHTGRLIHKTYTTQESAERICIMCWSI